MVAPLLGKSLSQDRPPKTLVEHTRDVVAATHQLFGTTDCPTRLGKCWLRFFRLGPELWSQFACNLEASCLLHDWGKANDRIQSILEGKRAEQLFRHEHLSVLLMEYPGVKSWLYQRTDVDWKVVMASVGSHHLKFNDRNFAASRRGEATRVMVDHCDFQNELVAEAARHFSLTGRPQFPSLKYWGFVQDSVTFDPTDLRESIKDTLLRIRPSPMLHAVRAALIVADAAGSGLPRRGHTISEWIGKRFNEESVCDAGSVQRLIRSRIDEIEKEGKRFEWSSFQHDCESLPDRALLLAPCGAGKTLAAWRWIFGRLKSRGNIGRIVFLYPTRATATEGFKDYVSWAPETHAALMHGTSGYDLDGMFPPTDVRSQAEYEGADPRLFALQHWSKRIFSATIDQFFAFMSYAYGPLCLLPLLTDSVIVVDEVHSFDKRMFSALLGFLESFDVPVLCMTATMQDGRKRQLQPLLEHIYDDHPDELGIIAGSKRYQVARIADAQASEAVRQAVAAGKRVLWVVNQVSRAQQRVQELSDLSSRVICYHSRFKLDDRVDRHRATVTAIRPGQPAAIVVSTQVCEMSLDIDADVLVTEECPITSLIQRMGRCRRGRDELVTKGPGEVYVYAPETERVYTNDDLTGVNDFIASLGSQSPVSQVDLETGLQRFGPKGADAPSLNSFLTSGGYADGQDDVFRDIEQFNVQAVLGDEIDAFIKAPKDKQPGFIVPVPRKLKPAPDPQGRLPSYLRVADERHYHPRTGYHDVPIR